MIERERERDGATEKAKAKPERSAHREINEQSTLN